ncbi:MAG: hypothetical protein OEZ24_05885 [Candidatus Bathyarchaeota archaeon]|nr:hypothetical protein [Candidatus Bathyarchaeota archaeon]
MTLNDLKQLAKELIEDGLTTAAKFLRNSANYMITFARLAIKQVRIPYTNNLIERSMGEIAKRVKHKWMHWSTTGLENLLNILLTRYCDQERFNRLTKILKPKTHIHSNNGYIGEKANQLTDGTK